MTAGNSKVEGEDAEAIAVADSESARGVVGSFIRRVAVDVSPLRESRAYRYDFVGQSVSTIGTQVTQVAVPLQVFRLTHSSLAVGLVGVTALVPLILFGLYGGAIADAVNRRTLLLVTSVGAAAVGVVLVVQAALGLDQLWLLYTCVAVTSAFGAVSFPTRRAILPQIVRQEQLAAANTLLMAIFSFGVVLGPLVAGVAISASGFAAAYAIDVGTFVVAFAAAAIGLPSLPPAEGSPKAGLKSVVDGLRFLRGRKNLLMTFVHDLNAMIFGMPRALIPALAATRFHGDATTAGLLYAAPGIGVLVVAATGGWTSRVRRQGLAVVIAIAIWALCIIGFGLAQTVWLACLMFAIGGGADAISAVFRSTIMQVAAPSEMQGRLAGVYMVVVAGGPRLGDLESGVVATATTPTFAAVSGGVACLAVLGILTAAVPSFLKYDAEHPTA